MLAEYLKLYLFWPDSWNRFYLAHYVRPSFIYCFPDSVKGIFPGPATTQKVYQGIDWIFPVGGATMIDSFQHVDKGDDNNINRWLT